MPSWKLKYLSEVQKRHPKFVADWMSDTDDVICKNGRIATIYHCVVHDESDRPRYDQPLWQDQGGAIAVCLNSSNKIALLKHFRTAISTVPSKGMQRPDLGACGRASLEFPRGLALPGERAEDTALREAEEETDFKPVNAFRIGELNPNTTYHLSSIPVVRVQLSDTRASLGVDENEPIDTPSTETDLFRTEAELSMLIRHGQIICGLTIAAFAIYQATK